MKRDHPITFRLNRIEKDKLEQARAVFHKRFGQKHTRNTFARLIILRMCNKIIQNENEDYLYLKKGN